MYNLRQEYKKAFNKDCETISLMLADCFNMGMHYGLLKAEEERESEATFDSAICYLTDEKFQSPSITTEKRQPHSEEWFDKTRNEAKRYFKGIMSLKEYFVYG